MCFIRGVRSVELVATNFEEAAKFYEGVWGLRPVDVARGTAAVSRHRSLPPHPRPASRRAAGAAAHRVRRGGPPGRRRLHRAVVASGCRNVARAGAACHRRRRLWLRLQGSGRPQPRFRDRMRGSRRRAGSAGPAAQDRARQSQQPATSMRASGSSPTTLGLRQIDENAPLWFLHCDGPRSLVDRARQDQPADPQSRRLRDARLRLRHARHRADEGQRLSRRVGSRDATGRATTCSPISAARTRCRSSTPSEVLQVDDSYVPRGSDYWKFPPGRSDHWGITQPRSARYYRVQRLFGFTEDGYRLAVT